MSTVDYFGELDVAAALAKAPPRTARLVVSPLSDVTSQPVEWFWRRWLPRGKFHLLGGYAGDGKSTLLASLAAAGSRGGEWPDGTHAPRVMRTLFVLGEDSAADTLKPRLELHDADMEQIFVMETVLDEAGRERFFNIDKHLDLLEEEVVRRGIDWMVIDPLTTIMPGTDRNAEGDTRDALTPLIKLADRRNVTVSGVAHVGKSGDARRAAQKILGATAFHALARVVWMVAPAEDERMVLGVVKSNLAIKPPSLVWTRDEDGPIRWEGVATRGVEDLLSNAPPATPRADAEGFLRDILAGGMKPCREIERAAADVKISKSTLRRAADAIPVKKWKDTIPDGPWYWGLPDGHPPAREPAPAHDAASEQERKSKMLTPLDAQVSIFDDTEGTQVTSGEHLRATTPIAQNEASRGAASVLEGIEDAHPRVLSGEHLRLRPPSGIGLNGHDAPNDPWARATRHRL